MIIYCINKSETLVNSKKVGNSICIVIVYYFQDDNLEYIKAYFILNT